MNETILDVLLYLFESYKDDEDELGSDREVLHKALLEAGFAHSQIEAAFAWLEALASLRDTLPEGGLVLDNGPASENGAAPQAIRVYHPLEMLRLSIECRGLLTSLEQAGVLSLHTRELVIDQIMALDQEDITLDELKWVVLMVLFNLSGEETTLSWLEHMVLDSPALWPH